MPDDIISAVAGTELKYCPNCKTLKPLSEFHDNKFTKDGKQSICKKCKSEYDKKRREGKKSTTKSTKEDTTVRLIPPMLKKDNADIIKTVDGRTLIRKDSSDNKPLSAYESRELFAELKRREYVWPDNTIYKKQYVNYDKI